MPVGLLNTGSFNLPGPVIRGVPQYYNSGSSGTGSTFLVTKDPTVAVGDTILIFMAWNGTAANPSITGFTSYLKVAQVFGIALFSRVADGTEGSTFTVNFVSGFNAAAVCVAYKNSNGMLDPVPSSSGQITLATTTIQGPGVTTTAVSDTMIWFGATRANGAGGTVPVITVPGGMVQEGSQTSTSAVSSANISVLMADVVAQAAGATGDQDGTASLSVDVGGLLVTLQSVNASMVTNASAGLPTATGVAQAATTGGNVNVTAGLAAASGAAEAINSALGTIVGSYIDETQYTGGLTHAQAITHWQSNSGVFMGAERMYEGVGVMPTSIPANAAANVAAGRLTVLSCKPLYTAASGSPLATGTSQATLDSQFNTFMAALVTGGFTNTNSIIPIWHEPYYGGITGSGGAATAADFIAMFQHYAPLVHSHGLVTAFITSVGSVVGHNENSYYPGDAYVDVCMTDFYIPGYTAGDRLGSGNSATDAAYPADHASPPKPFGIGEFNSSNAAIAGTGGTASPTYTLATAEAFWTYLTTYFNGRLHANQPCAPICMFNSNSGNTSQDQDSAIAVADGVTDPYNTAMTEWRNAYVATLSADVTAVT